MVQHHDNRTRSIAYLPLNDPPTTDTNTLSLHDALPISGKEHHESSVAKVPAPTGLNHSLLTKSSYQSRQRVFFPVDRKSTRLNSSHITISYAVFCLKKKS